MVEDDQNVGQSVQSGQNFRKPLCVRIGGVLGEGLHPGRAGIAGQIVDAEVEGLIAAKRRAPLDGNRNVTRGSDGAQKHRRGNRVVVGNGNQRHQA